MVMVECSIKPAVHKLKPRKAQLFRKAEWTEFNLLVKDFQQSFLSGHNGKTIDELWTSFSSALENFSEQCSPSIICFSCILTSNWRQSDVRMKFKFN